MRWLVLAMIGLGTFLPLATGEEAPVARGDGPVVRIWSNSGSPDIELREAEEFERLHPHVRIRYRFAEPAAMERHIQRDLAAQRGPDLLRLRAFEAMEWVAAGHVRAIDDLVDRQRQLDPRFFDNLAIPRPLFRFAADPRHPLLADPADPADPEAARRLLDMHGRTIGFEPRPGGFDGLVYNRRIFREAAEMFPDAGLLDEQGEPIPPATWSELLRVAEVITEYGRRIHAADERRPRVYGMVIHAQRGRDLGRGLGPLAIAAGSIGFNFAGRPWIEGHDEPVGFYQMDAPGNIGAFRLLLEMRSRGLALPGEQARHFEDVRSVLGRGEAAMLIDGWHGALIAAERHPQHADDFALAPIPLPDEAFEQRTGLRMGRGTPWLQTGVWDVITTQSRHPWETWLYMTFHLRPEHQRWLLSRGVVPLTREAAEKLGDRQFAPFRFQESAWELGHAAEPWPIAPLLYGSEPLDALLGIYLRVGADAEGLPLEDALREAERHLQQRSRERNAELEQAVRSGRQDPRRWTFPDWDPARAGEFYDRQRAFELGPEVQAELDMIRQRLPAP